MPSSKHITHTELIEFRQRIVKLNIARDEAMDCEIKLRRWITGIGRTYGYEGYRFQIDQDTGEIVVQPDPMHFEAHQSMDNSEKITAGRNVWAETEEEIWAGADVNKPK